VAGGALIALGAFLFHRMGRWSWPGFWGAILSTGGVIASKEALAHAGPFVLAFWSFGVAALLLIPLEALGGQPLRWSAVRRELHGVLRPAFGSLVATLLFYMALAHAPASKVNPLVRANLLFGFLFSYYHLKERRGWRHNALAGGLILLGLLLVALA
jgi:drug/metabolite transporter (DMT)-like permease